MRVLLVHPGHGFATADVYTGVLAGLRANGVEVVEYRLDAWLDTTSAAVSFLKASGAPLYIPDEYSWAAHPAVGWAIWRECTHALVITGQNFWGGTALTLKKAGIVTALLCTESPYLTIKRERFDAQLYDIVFTNERSALPLFGRAGVHYLAHAWNPDVHQPGPAEAAYRSDAFFCGTAFDERKVLFAGIDWSGINFVCKGSLWHGYEDQKTILMDVLPNSEAVRFYRSALVNINHHRTTADWADDTQIDVPVESLGPRAYELAACGAFQVCDDSRAELQDIFHGCIPTYRAGNAGDLSMLIRHYLKNPSEREALAEAQYEAIQMHSWPERAKQMISILDGAGRGALIAQPQRSNRTWRPNTA